MGARLCLVWSQTVHPPQPEVNPVIQIHLMYPNPVSFSTSARTDDVQNWIMTLPPAGPATSLCGPTPGRNSSLWVKWEKLIVFITQALGSVNSPQAALQCCPQIKLHLNVSWHLHFKQSLWLFFFLFLHRWLKITQKTLEEGTRSWERHSNKTQGVRVGVRALVFLRAVVVSAHAWCFHTVIQPGHVFAIPEVKLDICVRLEPYNPQNRRKK